MQKPVSQGQIQLRSIAILIGVVMAVSTGGFYVVYQQTLAANKAQLQELVRSQARLMEAMGKFNAFFHSGSVEGSSLAATLSQIKEAHRKYTGFGETGELVLAQKREDQIVFLLPVRSKGFQIPVPISFEGDLAGPMRLALSRKSGVVRALDHSGTEVLAAFEYLPFLELGLVAKIDRSEILTPFIRAAQVSGAIALVAIIIAALLNVRSVGPLIRSITEREERISRLLESTPDAMVIINENGLIEIVNGQAEVLFGYDRSELLGQTIELLVPERFREQHPALRVGFFRNPGVRKMGAGRELLGRHKDGTEFAAEISLSYIRAGGGFQAVAAVRDVTARKTAEAHERLVHQASQMAADSDSFEDSLQRCVDLICETTGWPVAHVYLPSSAMERLQPSGIWHCEDDATHADFIEVTGATSFARGEGLPGRIWESGEPAWIEDVQKDPNFPRAKLCESIGVRGAFGFPIDIRDETVAILEFFAEQEMSPDEDLLRTMRTVGEQVGRVLERRRADEAIRESKNFLLSVIDNSTAAIYAKDLEGRFLLVNKSMASMLGQRPADIVGRTPYDFFPKEVADRHIESDRKVVAVGRPIVEEEDAVIDGVERTFVSARFPILDSTGRPTTICGMSTDISERKEMERELEAAKIQADDANASKSMFVANMSHEIRTPMNAILGFAEILAGLVRDAQQRHYLGSIQSSGRSLLGLINDILDLSKVEAGKLELEYRALDVPAVFREMEAIFAQKIAEKGIELIIEIDPSLPRALVLDETRLRQILLNIIGNAIKFTDEGHVALNAVRTNPEADGSKIDLMFSIEDTGVGIPEDQQDRIFGAFEQTKGQSYTKFGGTGLGLAITKRLIEMMNGEVKVASQVGVGSTFQVVLQGVDVAAVDELEHDDDAASIEGIDFEPATILLVDDVETNRQLVVAYLQDYGFEIAEATNGQEAVDQARRYRPDLVLMDMRMPVMSGYDATRFLKEDDETRDIPVVALTASVMKQDEGGVRAICDGFLHKPVTRPQLVMELTRFLEHTQPEPKVTPTVDETELAGPETWSAELIDDGARQRMGGLLALLQQERDRCDEISATLTINDVEDFARDMQEMADQYGYPPLRVWGERLTAQASMFDLASIRGTLQEYPGVIEELNQLVTA